MWTHYFRLFILWVCLSTQNSFRLHNFKPVKFEITINKQIQQIFITTLISLHTSTQVLAAPIAPQDKDNQLVQQAFRDFDLRRFDESEIEFSTSLNKWKELQRPRDEIVSLLKARANVRLDSKHFDDAVKDYDEALSLMKIDGMKPDGTAEYPEYPDTFVGRALAKEGLADWTGALEDYNQAIALWGGGRGDGVNPYVLTFRGNTLTRLSRFEEAIPDYVAASDLFLSLRDIDRYSDARANLALAQYELGKVDEALKVANDIVRKNPGYADMRVLLAAEEWSRGDYINALKDWSFVCDRIDVGCAAYQDANWVRTVRRWPPSIATKLEKFLSREIPDVLKGKPGDVLAPVSSSIPIK